MLALVLGAWLSLTAAPSGAQGVAAAPDTTVSAPATLDSSGTPGSAPADSQAVIPGATPAGAPPPGPVTAPAGVDSSAAEAERVLREAAARRRTHPRPAARPRGRFDAPRWVMLRSALVPGWGQLHNGSWLKALGVAAGEVAFAAGILEDERELDRFTRLADEAQAADDEAAYTAAVDAYNARLSESIGRRWLLGGLLAYALADAYVDAHFTHFNVDFDAAPAGEGGGAGGGARLRLGWTF